ncbi:MAG: glycosyltransferase family 4 protein [Pyrinomonadaceae bacterium]
MRLLIVTHGLLTAEFGASQLALNLCEALRARGHDVTLWSPQPLPAGTRWWRTLQVMRRKLDEFIASQPPFDFIDCPATFVTRNVSSASTVIVRSTQPEIPYFFYGLRRPSTRPAELIRLPFEYAYSFYHLTLVLHGWRRAQRIVCLGTLERQWMSRWFPWWRGKLGLYFSALARADQDALAEVRHGRVKPDEGRTRFLWIGRWTAHKGPDVLLDFIRHRVSEYPQDTFTIAGCGPEAERNCPRDLIESGVVRIIPAFKRRELFALLAGHDAGLFTSKTEGWGLVLNEMLESGMPVYATHAGGVLDLQPFFESLLLPFPPPTLRSLQTLPELAAYLDTFNWPRIADAYLADILEHAPASKVASLHATQAQHATE